MGSGLVGTMGERTFVSLEFVLCVCELRVYVVCLFVCLLHRSQAHRSHLR